ncbi:MAG: hypothetical protein ACRC37_07215, partial [Lentisphaeria bacterium]
MIKVSNNVVFRLLFLIAISCFGAVLQAQESDRVGSINFTYGGVADTTIQFGLKNNGSNSAGVPYLNTGLGSKALPSPPPGSKGMFFHRTDAFATNGSDGMTTGLSIDFRNRLAVAQIWTLKVQKKSGDSAKIVSAAFSLDEGFTGSESNRISLVLSADPNNEQDFAAVNITDSLVISNLPEGTYYINYTYTRDATLTVSTKKSDNTDFGRWKLNESGDWRSSGESVNLEIDEDYTVTFEPQDGYVTPSSISGKMQPAGVTINEVYFEERARVEVLATFEGAAMPSGFQGSKYWKVKDESGQYVNFDSTSDFSFSVENQSGKTIVLNANKEFTAEFPEINAAWIAPESYTFTLSPEGHKVGDDAIVANYMFVPGEIVTTAKSMAMKANSVQKVD